MPDERLLIQQATSGDKKAFALLVRQYQNKLFAFIMRMTADRETALDLTQDTLLSAYQNLNSFRQEAAFSTWLFQIALNKTRNQLKRSRREVPMTDDTPEPVSPYRPDLDFEDQERQKKLAEMIGTLPPGQRAVFSLRYFEQMKFDDIARVHNISVSAAKTQFAEALKKLKKRVA